MEMLPCARNPDYSVTRCGRVFRTVRARFGKPVPHEIAQTTGPRGYKWVGSGKPSGLYTVGVHRLVAEAFLPNPDGLPEVAHIDGNPGNNSANNLRWSSHADNQRDRYLHGTHNRGENSAYAKLKVLDVVALRAGVFQPDAVAAHRGVSAKYAREVAKGKDWPDVVTR